MKILTDVRMRRYCGK